MTPQNGPHLYAGYFTHIFSNHYLNSANSKSCCIILESFQSQSLAYVVEIEREHKDFLSLSRKWDSSISQSVIRPPGSPQLNIFAFHFYSMKVLLYSDKRLSLHPCFQNTVFQSFYVFSKHYSCKLVILYQNLLDKRYFNLMSLTFTTCVKAVRIDVN